MNGPWYASWSRLVLAVIAAWRIWAEFKTVWPTVAAGGETLLRHIWRDAAWTAKGNRIAPRDEAGDMRDPPRR
jgi:hypothetical protein